MKQSIHIPSSVFAVMCFFAFRMQTMIEEEQVILKSDKSEKSLEAFKLTLKNLIARLNDALDGINLPQEYVENYMDQIGSDQQVVEVFTVELDREFVALLCYHASLLYESLLSDSVVIGDGPKATSADNAQFFLVSLQEFTEEGAGKFAGMIGLAAGESPSVGQEFFAQHPHDARWGKVTRA